MQAQAVVSTVAATASPEWDEVAVIIMVSALAAYAVTWIVRSIPKVALKNKSPWWLRIVSATSGALSGLAIGGWPWGLVAGFGAGSLTTVIVGFVKAKLKAKTEELGG
jgi:hypothetical protein